MRKGFNEPVLKKIVESEVLKPDGYVVLERSSDVKLSAVYGLEIFREKIFKNTTLTFLKCGGIRKND
jgi:16S rRNA G966 N2-methylase RsmD